MRILDQLFATFSFFFLFIITAAAIILNITRILDQLS